MDIKVTSTGKTFYRIDPALGAILLEALPSVFERVEPAPKPVHVANAASAAIRNVQKPEWDCGQFTRDSDSQVIITLHVGTAEYVYSGSVEGAKAHFACAGFECPADILERYANLKKRKTISSTDALDMRIYQTERSVANEVEGNRRANALLNALGGGAIFQEPGKPPQD